MLPRSGVSTSLQSLESLPIRLRKEAGESFNLSLLASIADPEQGRVYDTLGSGKFRDLEQALGYFESKPETLKLSQHLKKDWGPFLEELTDVFREPDRETFYYSLLELGGRLQRDGAAEQSARVYAALVEEQAAPEEVREKAKEQFQAVTGGGSGWRRFGYSLSQLPEELTHVTPLMAMTGAGLAFKGTRLALSLKWGERIESAWVLNAATTSAAFAAETVAFTGLEMGLGELGGVRQEWSAKNIYRHWGSGAATLLGLKASGWAVRSGVARVYEGSTVKSLSRTVTEKLAPQLGMFTGVLAGNRIAESQGFHEAQHGDSWLVTGAASVIRLNAVGLIQQRMNVFKGLELSAEIYRGNLISRMGSRSGWGDFSSSFGPQLVTAEGVRKFSFETRPLREAGHLVSLNVQQDVGGQRKLSLVGDHAFIREKGSPRLPPFYPEEEGLQILRIDWDTESDGIIIRARFTGNAEDDFFYALVRHYPGFARRMSIVAHEDGSFSYPGDAKALNVRLEREGFDFRYWTPMDISEMKVPATLDSYDMYEEPAKAGEVTREAYLRHLNNKINGRSVPELPYGYRHDLYHLLGYAAFFLLPRQPSILSANLQMIELLDRRGSPTRLDDYNAALTSMKQRLLGMMDGVTAELSDILLRRYDHDKLYGYRWTNILNETGIVSEPRHFVGLIVQQEMLRGIINPLEIEALFFPYPKYQTSLSNDAIESALNRIQSVLDRP